MLCCNHECKALIIKVTVHNRSIKRECQTLSGSHTKTLNKVEPMNYHKSALLIGDDNTEDGVSYMAFTTSEGIQWL